jgi:hypothetical protein
MSASDHERRCLKRLEAILRECHVTERDARKEERSGPVWARREEWARRPGWKMTTKRRNYGESDGTDGNAPPEV